MKIYTTEAQACREINPIISEYTPHLEPALLHAPETCSALPPRAHIMSGNEGYGLCWPQPTMRCAHVVLWGGGGPNWYICSSYAVDPHEHEGKTVLE